MTHHTSFLDTSAPDRVLGLGAAVGGTTTLLLANMTPDLQTVTLPESGGRRLTVLDEAWLREGAKEPEARAHAGASVVLSAYAVVRIDKA
ncbi:hypothetical protein I6F15_07735 [Bradyrhizobium sp. BRP14]|nr:hypothetical protein [Bradyrhizobium sp. BRP14]